MSEDHDSSPGLSDGSEDWDDVPLSLPAPGPGPSSRVSLPLEPPMTSRGPPPVSSFSRLPATGFRIPAGLPAPVEVRSRVTCPRMHAQTAQYWLASRVPPETEKLSCRLEQIVHSCSSKQSTR